MKKNLFSILTLALLILSGCGKVSEKDVIISFEKKVNESKSYYLEGKLDIINNEDVYTYDVTVSYQKEDNYKKYITMYQNAVSANKTNDDRTYYNFYGADGCRFDSCIIT